MTRGGARLWERMFPAVPEEIRDEFALLTAHQLKYQGRMLFIALALTTPGAFYANARDAAAWVRFGLPVLVGALCIAGALSLNRELKSNSSVRRARKLMRNAVWSSSMIAVMCSAWAVYSWLGAPPETRIYYPFILAMGALATAYCMSSVRLAAILNLVIDLVPMSALLFTSGSRMDLAAGISLVMAATFQLRMIVSHHESLVNLLMLKRQSRDLARTDPLTGLLNRRALLDNALSMGRGEPLRLLLIDVDHFKAVNDSHGHHVGDGVLCEIAELLARRAAIMGSVARIGGEEFAILGAARELPDGLALGLLADMRAAQLSHGDPVTVSIGVADAPVTSEDDWHELYQRADAALYAAKQGGRNRTVHASNSGPHASNDKRAIA